jgi:hypothetical protein
MQVKFSNPKTEFLTVVIHKLKPKFLLIHGVGIWLFSLGVVKEGRDIKIKGLMSEKSIDFTILLSHHLLN